MAAPELDRSEWARREQRAEQARWALLEHVHSRLPELRAILAQHRVREAYLFGSAAKGTARPDSDIDLAVAGCPPESFYRLGAQLERALDRQLDLLDLDRAPTDFAEGILRDGERLFDASQERAR